MFLNKLKNANKLDYILAFNSFGQNKFIWYLDKDNLQDYLLKDEKTNMVKVNKNGKFAELDYQLIKYYDNLSLVKINLKTGRSHQIRVQFSSRNLPLWGDQRYNKSAKVGEQIALYATGLSFYHPVTKELLSFKINTPDEYPWNMFKV